MYVKRAYKTYNYIAFFFFFSVCVCVYRRLTSVCVHVCLYVGGGDGELWELGVGGRQDKLTLRPAGSRTLCYSIWLSNRVAWLPIVFD